MQNPDHKSGDDIVQKLQNLLTAIGPNFEEVEKINSLIESFEFLHGQVRYSFRAFVHTLIEMGYGEFEAEKISQDIVLKPILFSLVPRILCADDPNLVTQPWPNESTDEHLHRTHISLMPEIIVYWFDQTIDEFNSHEDLRRSHNYNTSPIEKLISQGKQEVLFRPNFYLSQLLNCEDLFWAEEDPASSSNLFYRLLHPTMRQVNTLGGDIQTLLQLISDVITNEQRATELFRNKGLLSENQKVPRYEDLLLSIGLNNYITEADGNIDQETAYAIISNQGLLLVVYTSLLFSGQLQPNFGLTEMLQTSPKITEILLKFAALVRITDDLGDLADDVSNQVPNVLTLSKRAKGKFITLSNIEDTRVARMIENHSESTTFVQSGAHKILMNFYNQISDGSQEEWNPALVKAVNAVIFAAFINAQLNDVDATNAASQLLTGAD